MDVNELLDRLIYEAEYAIDHKKNTPVCDVAKLYLDELKRVERVEDQSEEVEELEDKVDELESRVYYYEEEAYTEDEVLVRVREAEEELEERLRDEYVREIEDLQEKLGKEPDPDAK